MQNQDDIIKRNRSLGLIVVAIIIIPMCLAYVMYFTGWGVSKSTTNKGELISPPQSIKTLELVEGSNFLKGLYANKASSKKWRLLVPITTDCQSACQDRLYLTRQVHVRLAEKAYRVERVLLALGALPLALQQQLEKEHPNTHKVETSHEKFSRWLSLLGAVTHTPHDYYLVDQEGYVMMRYNQSHKGKDLLSDIKKLLKFSYDR